jgi:hypothetical protein
MEQTEEVHDLGIDYSQFDRSQALTLRQALPFVMGRMGGPVHLQTLRNWASFGLRPWGPQGPILHFPAVVLSHTFFTMREWVEKFEQARLLPAAKTRPKRLEPTNRARAAQIKRAKEGLEKAGFRVGPTPSEAN